MNDSTYFLDRDNSGHWYLVRADRRVEWNAWQNLPDSDEESWDAPWFSTRLAGPPSALQFQLPDPAVDRA